ncbi:MAG: hypothetical protein HPY72_11600 [Anaerolineae bacterium]|nr:hypothetical protein [Anaerolineae bacterium]
MYYFEIEVLKRYFDHPEKYRITDSVIGGDILTRDEYYRSLSAEEADELTFSYLRYGKRQLSDRKVVISVIVHDLSKLPVKEQQYWYSYEIDSPNFSSDDKDFEKFIRRDFGAEIVDDEDPMMLLLDEIHKINQLDKKQPLFFKTENPHLFPPIINTKKGLSDACSELYKILGPDNLNQGFVAQILRKKLSFSDEDFINEKSKKKKSKMELFNMLLVYFQLNELNESLQELKDLRISADHKIINPEISTDDNLQLFRTLVQKLYENFRKLRIQLNKLLT